MRTIRVHIDSDVTRDNSYEDFVVDDDATEEQIEAIAEQTFLSRCNYGWSEIDPE